MKAGRELDALIAEKVMGWEKVWQPFFPSTEISDAWKVVEKCGKDFNVKYISHKKQYEAVVDYYFPAEKGKREFLSFGKAYAETAPLAICKAILKAKGIDIDE